MMTDDRTCGRTEPHTSHDYNVDRERETGERLSWSVCIGVKSEQKLDVYPETETQKLAFVYAEFVKLGLVEDCVAQDVKRAASADAATLAAAYEHQKRLVDSGLELFRQIRQALPKDVADAMIEASQAYLREEGVEHA